MVRPCAGPTFTGMTSLADLGFDDADASSLARLNEPGLRPARVVSVHRDGYTVRTEAGEALAEITGKLRFFADTALELPCVGDWVAVQMENEDSFGLIHAVLDRRSLLKRKAAGRLVDYQLIGANIDLALVMQSCDRDFNLRRLERYLVMIHEGRIQPVLLLSKVDLVDEGTVDRLVASVRDAGMACPVHPFSNVTGSGIPAIRRLLEPRKTVCLLGSSGVGKTSLLNDLLGSARFETQAVRERDSRGRHTTSHRQLVVLEGGAMIIDTPGMRELGHIGASEGLEQSFQDVLAIAEQCRFNDCSHTGEAGCAVLEAVARGELDEHRYENFLKLARESAFHEMTYAERRRRDRDLGRFYRAVLKSKKR